MTKWLRSLARFAHGECGGPGVGAIGMCFTGNFALTMMLEPSMLAPVLSQPSLPLNNPAGIEISPDEVKAVRERLEREDLTVLAYRFAGDKFCMAQRFAAYRGALGDRFIGRVLPDSAANTDLAPFFERHVTTPHSVVTAHLIDEGGQPTIAARDEILAFFEQRLKRVPELTAPIACLAAAGCPRQECLSRRRLSRVRCQCLRGFLMPARGEHARSGPPDCVYRASQKHDPDESGRSNS